VEKRGNKLKHSLLKMLWHRIDEDDLPGLSAQMAYYFLLSMFPLLIFLFSLLPYLPIHHEDLLVVIKGFAPVEVMDLIEKNLHDIMNHRHGGLLSFSIIGTIWSSSNGISAVVKAFNKAYNVKETRSFIVSSGMAILLNIGMILVFVIIIILPIFGKEIGLYIFSNMGFKVQFLKFWAALRWFISAVMLFLLFTGLYWIAPNTKLRCRSAFAGAAFSTIGWIISSVALSFYVDNFSNFSITYGSIGAIIVLMLWLYITAFIIVLGGEINAFYSERNKKNC
jgi:membrane protein